VHVLLKAMVSVRTQTTLRIVGAGAALPDLRQQVERLHLRDRVTFTNFVDHDDLPSVYRDLDAVVVPSIPTPSWREQFCRVAIEAMASGVPVIASDDGALSEVIGNGGVLTPSGDADALAAAIDQLGGNPAVWRERSIAALRRAQEYSWTSIAEQHHRMYVEATS
jgi:glycosyltransferase involved in cell wall biosynthesis